MGFFSSLATAVFDQSKENLNRLKGAKGEAQGASGMFFKLPSRYKVINDLLLPTATGTTQIDHVVLSNFGIFVIESKHVAGVIYGAPNAQQWTVCRGPAKFPLFNPLLQNAGHIRALVAITGLPESVFHSLVFFWSDDCRFGTPMPDNVRQMGLCAYIRSKRGYLLPDSDLEVASEMIAATRLKSTRANLQAHIDRVQRRLR
jgi:hypothetical protein